MRDKYNRITPDLEAWDKLGYIVSEIHEDTWTLEDKDASFSDFTHIVVDYDEDEEPEYTKEQFTFPDSKLVPFTDAEQEQIQKDIANWRLETRRD